MAKQKQCPACRILLDEKTDVCPQCRLTGLNQVFLFQKDRDAWMENVVGPHTKRLAPQIFAGARHILMLRNDGTLYGFGYDDRHQLNGAGTGWEKAKKLAEGVACAAAGGSHSILAMRDGEVRIFGEGEFVRSFPGFGGAHDERFANRVAVTSNFLYNDQFWIQDTQDQIWGFGANTNEEIEKLKLREFEFPSHTFIHRRSFLSRLSGTVWRDTAVEAEERRIEEEIRKSEAYQTYVRQYGENNCILFCEKSGITSMGKEDKIVLTPKVECSNRCIYSPIHAVPKKDLFAKKTCVIEKAVYRNIYTILYQDGRLTRFDYSADTCVETAVLLEDIVSIDWSKSLICCALKSGNILCGMIENLENVKKPDDLLEQMRTVEYEE